MSDDNGHPAPLNWQDAFTSPSWQIPELDEAVLAPPLEDYGLTDFRAPRDLPKPPDVDEILRGEYTGWVPVIRAGESLEQAQERVQAQSTAAVVSVEEVLVVETFEYGLQAEHEAPAPVEPKTVAQPRDFVPPIPVTQVPEAPVTQVPEAPATYEPPVQEVPVPQPTVATSIPEPTPNLHNVFESYEDTSTSATFESRPATEPVAEYATPTPPEPVSSAAPADAFHDTFDTSSWNAGEFAASQSAPRQTQSIDATFVSDSAPAADHSLELVIMRDEIQDLRQRLDASQKLVEEMMHKLASLAELALRSRS